MNETKTIAVSQSVECSFKARNVTISNSTGTWVYINIDSQSIPDANHYDVAAEPFTIKSFPVSASRFFGVAIGTAFLPTATVQGASVQILFEDVPRSPSVANISAVGATYRLLQAISTATIASDVPITLIPAVTGKSIEIFRVRAELYHAASAPQHHIWCKDVGATLWFSADWTTTQRPSVWDDFPGGLILPLSAPVTYYHSDLTPANTAPTVTALYQYV